MQIALKIYRTCVQDPELFLSCIKTHLSKFKVVTWVYYYLKIILRLGLIFNFETSSKIHNKAETPDALSSAPL
jgi:hypothetical protein